MNQPLNFNDSFLFLRASDLKFSTKDIGSGSTFSNSHHRDFFTFSDPELNLHLPVLLGRGTTHTRYYILYFALLDLSFDFLLHCLDSSLSRKYVPNLTDKTPLKEPLGWHNCCFVGMPIMDYKYNGASVSPPSSC